MTLPAYLMPWADTLGGAWPEAAGPIPSAEEVDSAIKLGAEPGRKYALAWAMYCRPNGATKRQVIAACGGKHGVRARDYMREGRLDFTFLTRPGQEGAYFLGPRDSHPGGPTARPVGSEADDDDEENLKTTTGYFTAEQFELLKKWKNQKRDESNAEQNGAYDELKKAYEVTEEWAHSVRTKLFPSGIVKIRKRPTSQANSFLYYNWARIYPSPSSPMQLAYTVGIGADEGFVVKIDTVGLKEKDPLRQAYLSLRGKYDNSSPIVAMLSAADGLEKSLLELVEWSVEAIQSFTLSYDEVVQKLGLSGQSSDEDLLKHFDGKPAFKTFRAAWSPEEKADFCRLARAGHAAGLDWWHLGEGIEVRLGRKNEGAERAAGVLARIRGSKTRKISWARTLGGVGKLEREPLTSDLIAKIEAALADNQETLDEWLPLDTDRSGLWPDQLREDPSEEDKSLGGDDRVAVAAAKRAFNRIYYGPPGTGKTYHLSKLLQRDYEQSMMSVSNEEWKSQFIAEKIGALKWWEAAAAALYDLRKPTKVGELVLHPFIKAIITANNRNRNIAQTLWQTLSSHAVEESKTVKVKMRSSPAIFDKADDSSWVLAGEWQEACQNLIDLVEELKAGHQNSGAVQRYSFVTFHQSYGYEEFVEGLRPVVASQMDSDEIQYEIRAGIFKDLCRRARSDPERRFAIVIDEINRGNISKIFGELITLVELDKREGAENALSVILPYSGEPFSVPPNVDIIGTMNTADRSLALLDTALRRRFEFIAVMPDARDEAGAPLHGLRVTVGEHMINVPQMLSAINKRVEALYDRDHCIGHAYFSNLAAVTDGEERLIALQQLFSTRIVPLLEEYFFEDWHKIQLVLADNQKPAPERFIIEAQDHQESVMALFGADHDLESHAIKRRYSIQESAFSNPKSYIGIYQPFSA